MTLNKRLDDMVKTVNENGEIKHKVRSVNRFIHQTILASIVAFSILKLLNIFAWSWFTVFVLLWVWLGLNIVFWIVIAIVVVVAVCKK